MPNVFLYHAPHDESERSHFVDLIADKLDDTDLLSLPRVKRTICHSSSLEGPNRDLLNKIVL